MRSVSAKKRKEKILPFPSNVSKLGFKAKRIISESLKNEAELAVSWLPACDSKSTDVDIADDEGIGQTLSDGGDEVFLSSIFAKSVELRHKIAHLKSIFGGGSEVSDNDVRVEVESSEEEVNEGSDAAANVQGEDPLEGTSTGSDEVEDVDEHIIVEDKLGKAVLTTQDAEFKAKLDAIGERLAAFAKKDEPSFVVASIAMVSSMSDSLSSVPPTIPKFSMEMSQPCSELKSQVGKTDASTRSGSKFTDEDPQSNGNILAVSQSIPKFVISDGDEVEGSACKGNQQAIDGEENGFNPIGYAITQPQVFEACEAHDNGNILEPRVTNASSPAKETSHFQWGLPSFAPNKVNSTSNRLCLSGAHISQLAGATTGAGQSDSDKHTNVDKGPPNALSYLHLDTCPARDGDSNGCNELVPNASLSASINRPYHHARDTFIMPNIKDAESGPTHVIARPFINDAFNAANAGHDLVHPNSNDGLPHVPNGWDACPAVPSQGQVSPVRTDTWPSYVASRVEPINAHTGFLAPVSLPEVSSSGVGPCCDELTKTIGSDDQGQIWSNNRTGRSWAGLFKPALQNFNGPNIHPSPNRTDGNCNPSPPVSQEEFKLEFVDHGEIAANLILKIPKDITTAGKDEWRTTLVGRFLGKKLPYSLVTNVTERFWAKDGLIDTLATDSGYFFFTFSSEQNRDTVLEGGPWFIAGQPLLLRPWKPHFSFGNEEVHTIPIWVNFYGVPLEYWNPKGISFISSFIGKPIRVDRSTASRRRITYARVCIEVNAKFDFFNEFHIESEDEVTGDTLRTKISLEYQWTPVRCKQCSQFGHDCSKIAKPATRLAPHVPYTRNGKGEGEWQVVAKKDKGKKIVDVNSPRTKDTISSEALFKRDNMFDALTQHQEESGSDPIKADYLVPSSIPKSCLEASSSFHLNDALGEVREDPTYPNSMDDVHDYDIDYGLEDEV